MKRGGERGEPQNSWGGGGLNKFLGTKGGGLLEMGPYLRREGGGGEEVLIEDFHHLCKSW